MFELILSHVYYFMSTPTTPASSPQCNAAASWKHKYELLEMQLAASNEPQSTRSKRQVVPSVLQHQLNYVHQHHSQTDIHGSGPLLHHGAFSLHQGSCGGE